MSEDMKELLRIGFLVIVLPICFILALRFTAVFILNTIVQIEMAIPQTHQAESEDN